MDKQLAVGRGKAGRGDVYNTPTTLYLMKVSLKDYDWTGKNPKFKGLKVIAANTLPVPVSLQLTPTRMLRVQTRKLHQVHLNVWLFPGQEATLSWLVFNSGERKRTWGSRARTRSTRGARTRSGERSQERGCRTNSNPTRYLTAPPPLREGRLTTDEAPLADPNHAPPSPVIKRGREVGGMTRDVF